MNETDQFNISALPAHDATRRPQSRFSAGPIPLHRPAQMELWPGLVSERVEHDAVNHPQHYTQHPSGVECIQITEHMGFCLGNAVKYIWRADLKGNGVEDLKKAVWYIQREIERMEAQ